ncbi:polar growth protein [Puccinia graminis f. sp. tritici]|uniref:Polar growth protein n=1 Tax=Puccinia graminis f. sp. tritici TaxID=56615 RepID=A0A5B0RER8_PUCGR|nr:polar growth protein [Puccinia graminis f. sp. tritici]
MKDSLLLCTCLAAFSATLHAQSGGVQHEKRGLGGMLGFSPPSQSSTPQATGPPRDPSAPVNGTCKALPLTRETWKTLNLDEYLRTYPGGDHLTVSQYAASKGAPNFDCGVGNKCNAGQLCYPVPAPDWYVLFAIQQWNIQTNNIIRALSYGVNFVQATISIILSALFPAMDPRMVQMIKLNFAVNAAFMMVSNTLFLDILVLFNSPQLGWNLFFNVLNNIINAASYGAAAFLPVPKEEKHEAFTEWSHLVDGLAVYEQKMIDGISQESHKILNAPISSKDGMADILKNGTYIAPLEQVFLPAIETALKNVTTALFLTRILRSMDAFVTIGSDVCNNKGPNGALEGDDKLSYCDTSGTMYNIVRVSDEKGKKHKDKEERTFPNAFVIENRLGFSTQFLTNASLSCQQKYGGFEHFPWVNTTIPRDPSADCVVNLPVCDLRNRGDLHHTIKKHGIVAACRQIGLPI